MSEHHDVVKHIKCVCEIGYKEALIRKTQLKLLDGRVGACQMMRMKSPCTATKECRQVRGQKSLGVSRFYDSKEPIVDWP